MRILTIIFILMVFIVGCSSNISETNQKEFKMNLSGIYELDEKYEISEDDAFDLISEDHYMKRRSLISPNESLIDGGFAVHIYELLNSNIKETMNSQNSDLLEFDTFQLDDSINLENCEIRMVPSKEDYPFNMHIAKCTDKNTTIFIIVVSIDSELAYDILEDVYSSITT